MRLLLYIHENLEPEQTSKLIAPTCNSTNIGIIEQDHLPRMMTNTKGAERLPWTENTGTLRDYS